MERPLIPLRVEATIGLDHLEACPKQNAAQNIRVLVEHCHFQIDKAGYSIKDAETRAVVLDELYPRLAIRMKTAKLKERS